MKKVRKIDVLSVAVGAIIGWGCFVMPGNSFLPAAGPLGTLIGMTLAGIMAWIIAQSYSYLLVKYPVEGGEFEYVTQAFGKTHAFICGWFLVLAFTSFIPLNGTAIGLITRYIFPGTFLQATHLWNIAGFDVYLGEVIITILIVGAFTILNIKNVNAAFMSQTFLALSQTAIIIAFPLIMIACGKADFDYMRPFFEGSRGESVFSGITVILSMAPWAMVGFEVIPQVCEEYEFDQSKAKALMVITIVCAVLMYSCSTLATAMVRQEGYANWAEYLNSTPFWAYGEAVETALGKPALYLLGFAMTCAVLSAINGFILSASRLMSAMSKKKALPAAFSYRPEGSTAPVYSIIFVGVTGMLTPMLGRAALSWIVDMTSFGTTIGFLYVSASAWKFAKLEGNKKVQAWGLAGVICSLIFFFLMAIPGSASALYKEAYIALFVWIALGVIFYFMQKKEYIGK